MPNEPKPPKPPNYTDIEHCPHCGEWLGGKQTCPACGRNSIDAPASQAEQPEPKPYPTGEHSGFCPFDAQIIEGPGGRATLVRAPCEPLNCALGIRETKQCCIKDAARSLHSLYIWNCDRTAGHTQLRQLIEQLSNRLGAILQSLAGTHQGIPFLAKHIREAVAIEGLIPIERQLGHIAAQLERLAPPADNRPTY